MLREKKKELNRARRWKMRPQELRKFERIESRVRATSILFSIKNELSKINTVGEGCLQIIV